MRYLEDTVCLIPACCVRAIWLSCILCCSWCTALCRKRSEKRTFTKRGMRPRVSLLYFGVCRALALSLCYYCSCYHCVPIPVCCKSRRNEVPRACNWPFDRGGRPTELFTLASSGGCQQPSTMCKTTNSLFWRLGTYRVTSFRWP